MVSVVLRQKSHIQVTSKICNFPQSHDAVVQQYLNSASEIGPLIAAKKQLSKASKALCTQLKLTNMYLEGQ